MSEFSSQFSYSSSGGYCSCGGCDTMIKRRTQRIKLYRGGKEGKAFHLLCAIREVNKTRTLLLNLFKQTGKADGTRRWAL